MSCVFKDCSSSAKKPKEPGLTFHKFPKNEMRKKAWVSAVGRENWSPYKSAVVCAKHFADSDFDRTSVLRTVLKEDAVPSKKTSVDVPVKQSPNAADINTTVLTFSTDETGAVEQPSVDALRKPSPNAAEMNAAVLTFSIYKTRPAEEVSIDVSRCKTDVKMYGCTSTAPSQGRASSSPLKAASNATCTKCTEREKEQDHASDITKATLISIENTKMRRKMAKVVTERNEFLKKLKKQERIIRQQEKKIQDLASLIEDLKDLHKVLGKS